ncbi:hypothetical protein FKM82_015393 [Ascaphus truei]
MTEGDSKVMKCIFPNYEFPGGDLFFGTTCPECGTSYFAPWPLTPTACSSKKLTDPDTGSDDGEVFFVTAVANSVSETVPQPEPIQERAETPRFSSRMSSDPALMVQPPLARIPMVFTKDNDPTGDLERLCRSVLEAATSGSEVTATKESTSSRTELPASLQVPAYPRSGEIPPLCSQQEPVEMFNEKVTSSANFDAEEDVSDLDRDPVMSESEDVIPTLPLSISLSPPPSPSTSPSPPSTPYISTSPSLPVSPSLPTPSPSHYFKKMHLYPEIIWTLKSFCR